MMRRKRMMHVDDARTESEAQEEGEVQEED
jgi:hypothetical protein